MKDKPKIGLGVVTYNRPAFFEASLSAAVGKVYEAVDVIYVYNDGSDRELRDEYQRIYDRFSSCDKIVIKHAKKNWGVALAKNKLLKMMLEEGCDYLFLAEDDIVTLNEEAINGYVRVCENTGIGHLSFAHGNLSGNPVVIDGPLSFWPFCSGSWAVYTRDCLNRAGLMDKHFYNSWQQDELNSRIASLGLTSPFWFFADATGSEQWLSDIAPRTDTSTIPHDSDWEQRMWKGLEYWRQKDGVGPPPQPESILAHPWPDLPTWPLDPRQWERPPTPT